MGHDIQVKSDYYGQEKYGSLPRFISYYHQTDSLRKYRGKKVLFVGVGDGMVPHYLKHHCGVNITTLDFDPDLKPDIVADIRAIPCADGEFDAVAVFEVLEHLPFAEFDALLVELARVSKGDVIVSLPYRHTGFDLAFKFPYVRTLLKRDYARLLLTVPIHFPGIEVSKQHYWEIDNGPTTFRTVRAGLRRHFDIVREYASFMDAYRHFFILEKKAGPTSADLKDNYVREYYDKHLEALPGTYTDHRWNTSTVARFDYKQTLRALKHALKEVGLGHTSALEVGPGDGVWTRHIIPRVERLTLLDQSSHMIARAKDALRDHTDITYQEGDFLAYAPTERYNLIVAMRCFEYFEDKPKAAALFAALLAPGGSLILTTKNVEYVSHKGRTKKLLHVGQLSRKEFIKLFTDAGLQVRAAYPATYRWKAQYGLFRFVFDILHRVAVRTNGRIRIPGLEERASESYLYIVSKPS